MSLFFLFRIYTIVFLSLVLGIQASCLGAQGGFDLLPPSSVHSVRYACLELGGDDDVHFVFSNETVEARKMDAEGEADPKETVSSITTEDVPFEIVGRDGKNGRIKQQYTTIVPYTENVKHADGRVETVQRERTEIRTRMVVISDVDNKKMVQYSTRIAKSRPVTVTSGKTTRKVLQTVFESEKRTEIVGIDEKLVRVIGQFKRKKRFADLKFSNVDGVALTQGQVAEVFGESESDRIPVVLIASGESLPAYFKHLLKPATLIVEDPFLK